MMTDFRKEIAAISKREVAAYYAIIVGVGITLGVLGWEMTAYFLGFLTTIVAGLATETEKIE
jgi:hypothetical protein